MEIIILSQPLWPRDTIDFGGHVPTRLCVASSETKETLESNSNLVQTELGYRGHTVEKYTKLLIFWLASSSFSKQMKTEILSLNTFSMMES